jgi:hypothetical protein
MDDLKLKTVVQAEIDNALGYIESETTEERRKAINYYNRAFYGNEVEGRSTIVTGEVAEAVDAALPGLLRVFTQGDDIVRAEPEGPGDEEIAKQITSYLNYIFYRDNPGFSILNIWFKDALLQKNGVVKVYWDDERQVNSEEYENLTEEELTLMLADETVEVVEQDKRKVGEVPVPPSPEEMMAAQQMGVMPEPRMEPVFVYDVKIRKVKKFGQVRIENVPPEEFIISKKARTITDSPFCAHRKLTTRSELIAMGFDADVVDNLPTYQDLDFTPERVARYTQGEQPMDQSAAIDKSMEEVETFECYIRTDFDDDGIAELRKVVYAGNEILENEEIDYVPFCSVCPIPMPHKFFGHSLADRTMDLQLIKSTITRQILDNLYLTNNARVMAVDGQVNLDDLLTVTPGGVVRVKSPQAVQQLSVSPVAGQSFPMLEYLDRIQEKRTGITANSQGLDANILQNTTAAAVAAMQNAAAGRIELIARTFAETGVRDLFLNILHLVCKYQDKARIVRLQGKYVSVDPREWQSQYDVYINVGLGTGTREQQLTMLSMILQKQEQLLGTPGIGQALVGIEQYRSALGRFVESAGFNSADEFFREITPEQLQQIQQQAGAQGNPQAEMMMAQVQAQIQSEQAKAQADIQLQQQKAQADIALQREKAAASIQLEREKAEANLQLKIAEFQAEAQMKAAKVGADITGNVQVPGSFNI